MTASTPNDDLEQIAAVFDRDPDPLAKLEDRFSRIDADPLDAYLKRTLIAKNASESTLKNYRIAYDQWRAFMTRSDRHFACPNDTHVKGFMTYLLDERDNSTSTVKQKVWNVARAYRWWQEHHAFPHPTDFDPFRIAVRESNLERKQEEADHPHVSLDDLRTVISGCTNVRERLFLVLQLKLGLRVGELLNIQFQDIAISHSGIEEWYPDIGTADVIDGYKDALYIPSTYERDGNKSYRPRILPLDDESKRVLLQYLPTRPAVEDPWLILSQRTFEKIEQANFVNKVWKRHFSEFNEPDEHRDITSHYGRHYFTSYWKLKQDISRELVQYMRGDKLGAGNGESIDQYLTAHYEDIHRIYLDQIFKLL